MIYTDENGEKYQEEDFNVYDKTQGYKVIRPIKPIPTHEVKDHADGILIHLDWTAFSDDQAQLIKEAVEAVMVYITSPPRTVQINIWGKIDEARNAIQKGAKR
jgi:hypothetical protein